VCGQQGSGCTAWLIDPDNMSSYLDSYGPLWFQYSTSVSLCASSRWFMQSKFCSLLERSSWRAFFFLFCYTLSDVRFTPGLLTIAKHTELWRSLGQWKMRQLLVFTLNILDIIILSTQCVSWFLFHFRNKCDCSSLCLFVCCLAELQSTPQVDQGQFDQGFQSIPRTRIKWRVGTITTIFTSLTFMNRASYI
jgi:hypothetical protein